MDTISFQRCFVGAFLTLMLVSGLCVAQEGEDEKAKGKISIKATAQPPVNEAKAVEKSATVEETPKVPAKEDKEASDAGVAEAEPPVSTTEAEGDSAESNEATPGGSAAENASPSATEDEGDAAKAKSDSTKATVAEAAETTEVSDNKSDEAAEVVAVEDVEIVVDREKGTNFIAKGVPQTDRVVNILTAQTVRPGTLALTIDHRAHDSFLSGEDAWFDYLGLDTGNLKIGIGLRLGLKEYLDFGMYRLSNGTDLFDVYEFDTKVRFLNQEDHYINMSLRIGASWFVQKDAKDASGFFSQLNVDRRLFGKLLVGTGFAFHTDSTNDRKRLEDPDPSAAVLGYLEWRPVRRFSLNGEMAANVAGFGSKFPIFAFSTRFLTHRHSFALVVANSQYMSADGIVSNSWRAFDELVFGFQIIREFGLMD